jgi:hypothetical protein
MTFDLHEGVVGTPVDALHDRMSCHAFATDDGDFGLTAVTIADGHHRRNSALNEVGVLDLSVGGLQLLPEPELDGLKTRLKQSQIGPGEARE